MDARNMLSILDRLLDDVKIALLTDVGDDGWPRARWMSPALVRGRSGFLYAVTSSKFAKAGHLEKNPKVQWLVQSKALDEILSLKGTIQILKNASLQQEVIEAIGGKLGTFWKMSQNTDDMVVLETVIEEMEYFKPVSGEKTTVKVS